MKDRFVSGLQVILAGIGISLLGVCVCLTPFLPWERLTTK